MKRTLVALLLVAALAAPAFGQFVPGSMQNGMTMGLFENEIDQAFQANPDFGDYDASFLFAGLGNPLSGVEDDSIPFYFNDYDAFDTGFNTPLRLGYYMAGSLPLSLYTSMDIGALSARDIISDYTTTTTAVSAVVDGTTTTNHRWTDLSTTVTPTDTILFSDYAVDLQALVKLGTAITGLYINVAGDNSPADVAAANGYFASSVATHNYNSAAGGEVPVATLDYTVTQSTTNINPAGLPAAGAAGVYSFDDTIRVGVPFSMRTGDMEHVAYLDATIASTDDSAAYSYVETLHADSVGGASVDDDTLAITSKTSATDVSLTYELTLPAGDGGDEWLAS
ncbi:MAG: hypothetical protein JXM71_06960, partial [Spirochaetales bacterium]|nr:hypothetical protein [Spirochaetales bacterium]